MRNKRGNFYSILLALLMFVGIFALFTSEPQTTGLVVLEPEIKINNIKENGKNVFCAGNIPDKKCSNTKPLFCDSGNLVYNCYECGCNSGETCGNFGVCEKIQKCGDGSIYGECSFLKGKFCEDGTLTDYCELCGCDDGEICGNGKCIRK